MHAVVRITTAAAALAAVAALSSCAAHHHVAAPPISTDRSVSNDPPSTATSGGPSSAVTTSAPPRSAGTSAPPQSATTDPRTSSAPPAPPATERITVRPVTADGRPVTGYRVTTETAPGFMCAGDEVSPAAVSPNIRWCGFSAMNTVTCWNSAVPSTALCLRDPLKHVLVRIRYQGTFAPIAAPRNPVPQEVVLDNGVTCLIRDGGAWMSPHQHPNWVGRYACRTGANDLSVNIYGPSTGNGIDQTAPAWTVLTAAASGSGPITQHQVKTAYFAGTA